MERDLKNSELYEQRYGWRERRSTNRFLVVLLLVVTLLFGVRLYWVNHFGGVVVSGSSMYKTLYHQDQLLMKYTENGEGAKRGDVIVLDVAHYPDIQLHNQALSEQEKLKCLIKRLIAVEGDSVKCVAGQVYIRYAGEAEYVALDEPYAYYRSAAEKARYHFGPYTLGEGEIFFLGDNRTNSMDSRYMEGGSHLKSSLYKQTDIIGVVPEWAIENRAVLEKIFFRD